MIRYFTKHPTASNLLMLIFLVIGIFTIPSLRRETFPDFTPSEVDIRIAYPGATAEEIEQVVCQRVEDATRCEAIRSPGASWFLAPRCMMDTSILWMPRTA